MVGLTEEIEMNDMITIPKKEYDRLVDAADDLADIKAIDKHRANPEEAIPSEYAARLIAGEGPLRVWRDYRGYTQADLATLSDVNRVQIADIEAGRKSGSIATIKKLAEALSVTIDDLV